MQEIKKSGKSCFSNSENGSLLIASLKLKKGKFLIQCKKDKAKSSSKVKRAVLVSDSSSKGMKKSIKIMSKKILQKAIDKKSSSKKMNCEDQRGRNLLGFGSEQNGKKVKLKKKKKKKNKKGLNGKAELDEPSRLQRRTRYLMVKMKLEQNLIDAYSGEGWKGQSREKIRPVKELLRAKKQILKCKLGIRDAIHQLDSLSTVGCIEDSVIAPDGSVSHEHIFCSKCKSNEVSPDNDIVLCDGTCNCAFHQRCLDPPLDTENIPPGDQGWYCKFCDCRMEIIEAMNAHLGTQFSVDSCWQDFFNEEATFYDTGGISINQEEEWPSDDSEDGDYDPGRRENSTSEAGTDDDASRDGNSATSLDWSLEGEVLSGSKDGETDNMDFRNQSIYSSLDSDETSDGEVVCGRRQRTAVDYKKLYVEMFGKDAPVHEQVSEDEDWGPGKRKRRGKESDAASTLMTLYENEKQSKKCLTIEAKGELSRELRVTRPLFRIPPSALEKLRQVFEENELPSRTVKENLSKDLGLDPGKVSKWFKNARYLALKSRKRVNEDSSSPEIPREPRLDDVNNLSSSDLDEVRTTSTKTKACNQKHLNQALKKTELKSICCSLKRKRASVESPSKSKEISDDVSLKRLMKSKTKKAKKINSILTRAAQAAEAEMERLCRAKVRLENLKQKLLRLQNSKSKKTKRNHLHQQTVVFVPIAKLREQI
ncbi:pathogenesis-related homeodomain protein [Mercurialis annua]|uniref:pathogenesis-related homeodomain protein n=1 Tax=Mercurialis annua TaxID=3986 RepID=UPI00215FBC49|nr:pathogenesis-related homeodomain protein [Mercurialis annua]